MTAEKERNDGLLYYPIQLYWWYNYWCMVKTQLSSLQYIHCTAAAAAAKKCFAIIHVEK